VVDIGNKKEQEEGKRIFLIRALQRTPGNYQVAESAREVKDLRKSFCSRGWKRDGPGGSLARASLYVCERETRRSRRDPPPFYRLDFGSSLIVRGE